MGAGIGTATGNAPGLALAVPTCVALAASTTWLAALTAGSVPVVAMSIALPSRAVHVPELPYSAATRQAEAEGDVNDQLSSVVAAQLSPSACIWLPFTASQGVWTGASHTFVQPDRSMSQVAVHARVPNAKP